MKHLPLAAISDALFYALCTFLLTFGALRYFSLPLWLCAVCASLLFFAVGAAALLLLLSSRKKKYLNKREQEQREALLLHLALEKPERVRSSLLEALTRAQKNAHCEGDTLSVNGIPAVPLFTLEPVGADAIARLLSQYGSGKFVLFCNSLTGEAEKLTSFFGVEAVQGDGVYALFTQTDSMPSPLICGQIPKKSAKQKLRRSFSKGNARPFFVSGALLLLMSLFTFFPLYYVITGGILLLCAVAVRLFGCA